MSTKEFVCIICPRSCHLRVDESGNVSGNSCPRGATYGRQETFDPRRTLTTTVKVSGGTMTRCPVRSDSGVPRDKQKEISLFLKTIKINAPIKLGDVVYDKPLGIDCKIIATRDIEVKK